MDGTSLYDAFNMAPLSPGMPGMMEAAQAPQQAKPRAPQEGGSGGRKSTPISQLPISQQQVEQQTAPPQPKQRNQDAPVFYDPRDMYPSQRAVVQHFTEAVPPPQQAPERAYVSSSSYFDVMVQKRRDVMKMVAFAVIILLAISIHTVVDFGLKEAILSSDFTFKQELGIRFIYPFLVFLLLWNLKALTGSR